MAWCGLEGVESVVERFRRGLRSRRLGSAYLFCGPPGVGKRLCALYMAKALLCERHEETDLEPCLECPSCLQIAAGTHPDVDLVGLPEGKSQIPVELLIGDPEHRMREGLCHRISLRPLRGRRRVAIIDDADHLNVTGANALLKTLEEPPPGALLFLISSSLQRQLPTIRSRCQIYHFQPLPDEFIQRHVLEQEWVTNAAQAMQVAEWAEGSLDRAKEFSDPAIEEFRRGLVRLWEQTPRMSWELAKYVESFVDALGKDSRFAAQRRSRLRVAMLLMVHHLRQAWHGSGEAREAQGIAGAEATCARIERSLLGLEQIEANANLATLVAAWMDDLCQEPPLAAPHDWGVY